MPSILVPTHTHASAASGNGCRPGLEVGTGWLGQREPMVFHSKGRKQKRASLSFPSAPSVLSRGTQGRNKCLLSRGLSLKRGWERVGKIESEDRFFLFSHLPFSSHFKSLVSNLFEDMNQPLFYIKKVFFFFFGHTMRYLS